MKIIHFFFCRRDKFFINLCHFLSNVSLTSTFRSFTKFLQYIFGKLEGECKFCELTCFDFKKGPHLFSPAARLTPLTKRSSPLSSTQMASDFAICQVHGELKCILHTNILHTYLGLDIQYMYFHQFRVVGKSQQYYLCEFANCIIQRSKPLQFALVYGW